MPNNLCGIDKVEILVYYKALFPSKNDHVVKIFLKMCPRKHFQPLFYHYNGSPVTWLISEDSHFFSILSSFRGYDLPHGNGQRRRSSMTHPWHRLSQSASAFWLSFMAKKRKKEKSAYWHDPVGKITLFVESGRDHRFLQADFHVFFTLGEFSYAYP